MRPARSRNGAAWGATLWRNTHTDAGAHFAERRVVWEEEESRDRELQDSHSAQRTSARLRLSPASAEQSPEQSPEQDKDLFFSPSPFCTMRSPPTHTPQSVANNEPTPLPDAACSPSGDQQRAAAPSEANIDGKFLDGFDKHGVTSDASGTAEEHIEHWPSGASKHVSTHDDDTAMRGKARADNDSTSADLAVEPPSCADLAADRGAATHNEASSSSDGRPELPVFYEQGWA